MKSIAEIEKQFYEKCLWTDTAVNMLNFFRTHLEERDREIIAVEHVKNTEKELRRSFEKQIADLQAKLEEAERKYQWLKDSPCQHEHWVTKAEILEAKLAEAEKEIERLKILIYSNDTSEWKSAAFQKLKTQEGKIFAYNHLLEKAERALEVYADRDNWFSSLSESSKTIFHVPNNYDSGYKFAKQVLTEIRKNKNG